MSRPGAELEAVSASARAGRGAATLEAVTAHFGLGVHVVQGGRADGASLLLELLALRVRPRTGTVRVLDQVTVGRAGRRAGIDLARRAIAYVPAEPLQAPVLRVHEVLALASAVRQERRTDPRARLEVLGLGALSERRLGTLSPAETRAVSITEALTSQARLVLLEEPLVNLDARAEAALIPLLREEDRAATRTVVVVTASGRDAGALASEGRTYTLARGALAPRGAPARTPPGGAVRLRALLTHPRPVLARLASEPCIKDLHTEGDSLILEGDAPATMAAALARVVLETEGTLLALDCERVNLGAPRTGAERAS